LLIAGFRVGGKVEGHGEIGSGLLVETKTTTGQWEEANPCGMAARKAKATTKEEADSQRE